MPEKKKIFIFFCGDFVVPVISSDKRQRGYRVKSEQMLSYFQNRGPDISRIHRLSFSADIFVLYEKALLLLILIFFGGYYLFYNIVGTIARSQAEDSFKIGLFFASFGEFI